MFDRYRGGGGGGGADNSITQMAVMDVSILNLLMMEEEEVGMLVTSLLQDENVSQAITQGGGCLTLHSKWKSAFDDSEASDNETEMKGENLASPEHAKGGAGGEAGSGGGEQQVAATTRALELSRITENTSCKEEGKGDGV